MISDAYGMRCFAASCIWTVAFGVVFVWSVCFGGPPQAIGLALSCFSIGALSLFVVLVFCGAGCLDRPDSAQSDPEQQPLFGTGGDRKNSAGSSSLETGRFEGYSGLVGSEHGSAQEHIPPRYSREPTDQAMASSAAVQITPRLTLEDLAAAVYTLALNLRASQSPEEGAERPDGLAAWKQIEGALKTICPDWKPKGWRPAEEGGMEGVPRPSAPNPHTYPTPLPKALRQLPAMRAKVAAERPMTETEVEMWHFLEQLGRIPWGSIDFGGAVIKKDKPACLLSLMQLMFNAGQYDGSVEAGIPVVPGYPRAPLNRPSHFLRHGDVALDLEITPEQATALRDCGLLSD